MATSQDMSEEYDVGLGARLGLFVLVLWALLCAAWNIIGTLQILDGERPIGPATSFHAAGFSIALGVCFIVAARWKPILFLVLALVAAALAGVTVWNAFHLRSSLWPSEFWRFVAVSFNAAGFAGALLVLADGALYMLTRSRSA
jgi:hypothetical protein